MKKHNFCAGPSILPKEVIIQAGEAILDINGSGLSLLEISHRSKTFIDIMEEARSLALELTGLNGKDYTVLFLQGGASMQFLMVAYNLLSNKAAYLDTGSWSKKAIKEAKLFGEVSIIASSEKSKYDHIPKDYIRTEHQRGIYFTTLYNNTNDFLCGKIEEKDLVKRFDTSTEALVEVWKNKHARKVSDSYRVPGSGKPQSAFCWQNITFFCPIFSPFFFNLFKRS